MIKRKHYVCFENYEEFRTKTKLIIAMEGGVYHTFDNLIIKYPRTSCFPACYKRDSYHNSWQEVNSSVMSILDKMRYYNIFKEILRQ